MRRARRWLPVSGFVRATATSTAGVTLGGFLGRLDAYGAELGLEVSAGLAGGALVAILATLMADRSGGGASFSSRALSALSAA